MKRISFGMTIDQFNDGTKDVTRRMGWLSLAPGDRLRAVNKVMGFKKGERATILGEIEVVSVRRERLDTITADDVRREGFPDMTPDQFVAMFRKAMGCKPSDPVTRIEFRKLEPAQAPEAADLVPPEAVPDLVVPPLHDAR